MYSQDCKRLFGKRLKHHVEIDEDKYKDGRENTKKMWKKYYNVEEEEDNEMCPQVLPLPSHLQAAFKTVEIQLEDIIEDRCWLRYYKSYIQDIRDLDLFFHHSLSGYRQFLIMCGEISRAEKRDTVLEPSYAMDLFWHTHMLHPKEYRYDSYAIANQLLIHIPWPKDMTVNEMFDKLDEWDEKWKAQFGESIHSARDSAINNK